LPGEWTGDGSTGADVSTAAEAATTGFCSSLASPNAAQKKTPK